MRKNNKDFRKRNHRQNTKTKIRAKINKIITAGIII
jgi:hypothetical protein